MRKSEIIFKALLILFIACVIGTCDSKGTLHEIYVFDEEYWGEWIRMDTGDIWYFASNYRKLNNDTKTSLEKDMTMKRESQNVIKITEGTGTSKKEYFLYASRIRNSTFEGTAVKDDASSGAQLSLRGIFLPIGSLADVNSIKNGVDKQTVEIGDNGKLEAENIIAGDNYTVTIDGYEFEVTPNTDGDNVGTLTLTKGVNIKTSVVPQSSSVDLMRLFSGQSYDLKIIFTNIGEEDGYAMTYKFELPSGIVNTRNPDSPIIEGRLQTIEPEKTQDVNITIKCEAISEDFEFKKIAISAKDFKGKTWDDSVSLKVNKESITFKIRSEREINGVVIVPNGKTYYFKTTGGSFKEFGDSGNIPFSSEVSVPKYIKDYLVVFSGASAITEAAYSFAVDNIPAANFNEVTDISILNKHNETEGEAYQVYSDQEVMAYLLKNKANYYKVRFR